MPTETLSEVAQRQIRNMTKAQESEMKIKTFAIKNNPNILGFVNYDRVPEESIVEAVLQKLRGVAGINVADVMQQLPYSYENRCTYNGAPFTVICDDDYGALLYAEDENVLNELKLFLES